MRWLPSAETRAAVVQHPIVLAGIAVVALLALTAGVLVVIDSARVDGGGDGPQVIIDPVTTRTPGPAARTAIAIGLMGTTRSLTAVRVAPGSRSAVRGTLNRDTEVQIDGRTEDSGWLRILFPPRSDGHGWVDAEDIDISGDLDMLAMVDAEPPELVNLPTSIPQLPIPTEDLSTPGPDGTTTPEADGLPDLVVGTPVTIADGKLFVTVINQGSGRVTATIVVAVFNAAESQLVGGATVPGITLEPGTSIDVGTGYEVSSDEVLVLIVDPNGEIEESDNTNNRVTISIAIGD